MALGNTRQGLSLYGILVNIMWFYAGEAISTNI